MFKYVHLNIFKYLLSLTWGSNEPAYPQFYMIHGTQDVIHYVSQFIIIPKILEISYVNSGILDVTDSSLLNNDMSVSTISLPEDTKTFYPVLVKFLYLLRL